MNDAAASTIRADGTVLGFDVGARRIGVAIGSAFGRARAVALMMDSISAGVLGVVACACISATTPATAKVLRVMFPRT